MRPYELGNPELDQRLRDLVRDAVAATPTSESEAQDTDLIRELLTTGLKMLRDSTDRADLKLANAALKEMRYSFLVFSHYKDVKKVTIFGSARTPEIDPDYQLAAAFARQMSDEHRWMVITGAGPGIMEAGNLGAGRDLGFGINIRLPFEDEANPYVHESRLINFKYFFTRKLMFMKESNAFALFPGGFGTMDETFELLVLMQTGKSDLHPVVLMEDDGGTYWDDWIRFVESLVHQGMILPDDVGLFRRTSDVEEACREVTDFYRSYHSQRFVDGKLVLRLQYPVTPALLEALNDEFGDIVVDGRIEAIEPTDPEIRDRDHLDLARIRFHFDRKHLARLRALIDRINKEAPPGTA